jgi:hypothetical protein
MWKILKTLKEKENARRESVKGKRSVRKNSEKRV